MHRIADGAVSGIQGARGPEGDHGPGPRIVRIGLMIYLTPVILGVLLIGGTSMVAGHLTRAIERTRHGRSSRATAGVATGLRKDEGQNDLSSRRRRSRAAR